ncbi:hypothetical protein FQA47_023745, partial [Oryzias melastigma]
KHSFFKWDYSTRFKKAEVFVCAACGQAFLWREMIPHEVQRTRPPIGLCNCSRCDVVMLSPAALGSPLSR